MVNNSSVIFNYFFTSVGPEYKKKFARNVGIGVLILFAFYGVWSLVVYVKDPIVSQLPENDPLCSTHILVQTTQNTDRKLFSKTVLDEIGKIDSRFVYGSVAHEDGELL